MSVAVLAMAGLCAEAQLISPEPGAFAASLSEHLRQYDVILRPEKAEPEWWAGAPTVARDTGGAFWMVCRMRTAEGERGLRGYALRILKSVDGATFDLVRTIAREEVGIPGFERPALVRDPKTGLFKLYVCGPRADGTWAIFKFNDVAQPDAVDVKTLHPVVEPGEKQYDRDVAPTDFKDPVVIHAQGKYHCYVIGYVRRNERVFHFFSDDGERWTPAGNAYTPVMELEGWHNFFVRPASVVPVGVGYLFVYEGSNYAWYDPVYNIATGLGFTFDLHTIQDLTPDAPLFVSTTPNDQFATFRYSHWIQVDDEMWIYAEVAAADKTHEVRRYRIPFAR